MIKLQKLRKYWHLHRIWWRDRPKWSSLDDTLVTILAAPDSEVSQQLDAVMGGLTTLINVLDRKVKEKKRANKTH